MRAHDLTISGLSTRVWEVAPTGPSRDATVVCLHGLAEDGRCLEALAQRLAAAGYRVLLPDAPGHGHSVLGSAFGPADRATSASGVIEELAGAQVVLVGHSMGGETAAHVAADRPDLVRGVFLEEPVLGLLPEDTAEVTDMSEIEAWIRGLQNDSHAERLEWVRKDGPTWDEVEYEPWAVAKAAVDLRIFEAAPAWLQGAMRDVTTRLTQPIVLVRGDFGDSHEYASEVSEFLRRVPQAVEVHIAGTGHCVRRDNPQAFEAALLSFAAGLG